MNDILLSIESVIGSSTKSTKDERLFHCPFCYHHKPKLSINFGRRIGFWKCWVCDESGKRFSTLLYRLGYSRNEIEDILQDHEDFSYKKEHKEENTRKIKLVLIHGGYPDSEAAGWLSSVFEKKFEILFSNKFTLSSLINFKSQKDIDNVNQVRVI